MWRFASGGAAGYEKDRLINHSHSPAAEWRSYPDFQWFSNSEGESANKTFGIETSCPRRVLASRRRGRAPSFLRSPTETLRLVSRLRGNDEI